MNNHKIEVYSRRITLNLKGGVMEFLDSLNLYLSSHPVMFDQLVTIFRIKYWLLSGIAIYFLFLPSRESRKQQKEAAEKDGQFLA